MTRSSTRSTCAASRPAQRRPGSLGPLGLTGATGVGNLAGVRSRLPYLADLGVDAIWFNPWYPSPMADAGYDVADYRAIDPMFGTLDEAEKLIAEAHDLGIRIILDVVPNHGSNVQPWFTAALAAAPGSPERDRFIFRPGRGAHGELPPNNWTSEFGGPAWTRADDPDGQPGQWYLHLFTPEQPDFNWANTDVQADFEDVLRFWFDRGVDGFRIDSAVLLAKDPAMADYEPDGPEGSAGADAGVHPFVDRDEVHEVYRAWRRIADSYPGMRVLIGEVWLPDVERTTRYLRPGELQTVFNFDFLRCPWDGAELRSVIDATLASHARVGAPATWVLSNHDVIRNVTRYGRADTSFDRPGHRIGEPTDLVLGTRRARAAALLSLSLPGTAYVYQGEELGLWEVEDLPDEDRQDPMWQRSGHAHLGRDGSGCRCPGPATSRRSASWPTRLARAGQRRADLAAAAAAWSGLTAEAEAADPDSMLSLYRHVLAVRHREPAFATDSFTWLPAHRRPVLSPRHRRHGHDQRVRRPGRASPAPGDPGRQPPAERGSAPSRYRRLAPHRTTHPLTKHLLTYPRWARIRCWDG